MEKQDEALKGHVFYEAQGFLAAFHTRVHSSLKRYGGRLSGGARTRAVGLYGKGEGVLSACAISF